ncbi:MAG: RsmB/NOP family class I SAM-dependent RNA methyltransferase, partial [Bacteroidetes bacterium]|nr:RsmB/NOP family class I SAM-dependent RNA methyltransferase [Bacteroidota bacterium]
AYPKLGSRDRKLLSEMAYSWYRCTKGWDEGMEFDKKIDACLFLCSTQEKLTKYILPEDWAFSATLSIAERLEFLEKQGIHFDINKLFPYSIMLSDGIKKEDWLHSMLQQPDLFLRIRKEKERIIKLLRDANISFAFLNDNCIALPNGAAIDKLLPDDAYVVQDVSSQETGGYFHPKAGEQWYDCCSGAGGKSLLLKDMQPDVQLSVSDKRDSILHNLKNRFKLYHHTLPVSYNIDVSDKQQMRKQLGAQQFDVIICDVPCTGSGTWARTPEQLYFFEPRLVGEISALQKRISSNVAAVLKANGRLIYITCSVFKEENENVINALVKETGLEAEETKLVNGIQSKADSMFVTVLKKKV